MSLWKHKTIGSEFEVPMSTAKNAGFNYNIIIMFNMVLQPTAAAKIPALVKKCLYLNSVNKIH